LCDTDFSFGGEQEIPLTIEIKANINFRREIFESESVLGKAEKIVKDIVEDVIESETIIAIDDAFTKGYTIATSFVANKVEKDNNNII